MISILQGSSNLNTSNIVLNVTPGTNPINNDDPSVDTTRWTAVGGSGAGTDTRPILEQIRSAIFEGDSNRVLVTDNSDNVIGF